MEADTGKKYARPAEPFDSDPEIAAAQLFAMRPRLIHFFQTMNIPPGHDEELADNTLLIVWMYYSNGAEIRDRRAYTYQVAKSQLVRYLQKGRGSDVQMSEIPDAEQPHRPDFSAAIDNKLDNRKKTACIEECRQTLVDSGDFSEKIIDAFFRYHQVEGYDREQRDGIAKSTGIPRLILEQMFKRLKKSLINCTRECMTRRANKRE
jgi:hypothetical protein